MSRETAIPDAERCRVDVYKRDTYRREGTGRNRWVMHYNKERCRRRAVKDGRCWQHQGRYLGETLGYES